MPRPRRFLLSNQSRAFTPTDIPGLALWLDASDAATITLDGSNNVSQWNDKSGNARHASQASVTLRPGYLTSGINGLPAIVGDGVDDIMTWTALTPGTIHNFYIVAAYDTGLNQYPQYSGMFGVPPGQVGWNDFRSDISAHPAILGRPTSGVDATLQAANIGINPKSGSPMVFSYLRNGGTYKVKVTGQSVQSQTIGGGAATATVQNNRIFANYFKSISYRIAELVCYTKDLSESEEASLSAYFTARYGVGI